MDRFCCTWILAFLQVSCIFAESCNWRYYGHYEQKGCKPVLGEEGCPVRFQCPPLSDEISKKCLHNGNSYNDMDIIKDTGACASCSCVVDSIHGAYIECWAVDCPSWGTQDKSCYMAYKPGNCCPEEICPTQGRNLDKHCTHKGITYRLGEFIQTEDPCKICICTKKWTGEDGYGCEEVNCLDGMSASKIRRGCLPIFEEDRCCLTEMYCDGIYGATPVTSLESSKDDLCHYRGKYYERGSTAYLSTDIYLSIECKCEVPPDFTCLRKSLPETE